MSFPSDLLDQAVDGRLLLMLGTDAEQEPRFQVGTRLDAIPIFGIDVEGLKPGQPAVIDSTVFGYPTESLRDLPSGDYQVQALLHRYETFQLATGHTVRLPMDRGEGQQWRKAPGNLLSTPQSFTLNPLAGGSLTIELDQVISPIEPPADNEYVKHISIKSELLSEFWGREMRLGAHVLLPHGFDEHPEARYPLMVFHGHFPADFGGGGVRSRQIPISNLNTALDSVSTATTKSFKKSNIPFINSGSATNFHDS